MWRASGSPPARRTGIRPRGRLPSPRSVTGGERPAVCAAQPGRRRRVHRCLGCKVRLQPVASGDSDPRGRERRERGHGGGPFVDSAASDASIPGLHCRPHNLRRRRGEGSRARLRETPGPADSAHEPERRRRGRDVQQLQGDGRRCGGRTSMGRHPLADVVRAGKDGRRGDRALRRPPHAEADSRARVMAASQEDSTRPFQTRTAYRRGV